jgi:hypothetical protein
MQKGPANRPFRIQYPGAAQAIEPIIIMLPHIIIMGMPLSIMAVMRRQHSMNISLEASSIGIISHVMPLAVILQLILLIIMGIMPPIGIIPPIIIGFIIGFIMGIMPLIGIIPIIMGFIIGIILPIMGMLGIFAAVAIICSVGVRGDVPLEMQAVNG